MRRDATGRIGLIFVIVLAAGTVLSLVGLGFVGEPMLREPAGSREHSLLDGSAAVRFDDVLERAHPLRDTAVALMAAGRYALLRQATGGAVVGAGGWLFTMEELERHPRDDRRLNVRIEEIIGSAELLRERGIDLAVVIVPAKARLYPEKLPARRRALADHPRYREAVRRLHAAQITVVDLRCAFAAAMPTTALFFARDTHWTPAGARVAADTAARVLREAGIAPESGRPVFAWGAERVVEVDGDLMRFVPVGRLRGALGLTPECAPRRGVREGDSSAASGGGTGLFGELSIPVALVGTSYSQDERWGFADALKVALGADVLNVAARGEGPFAPMRAYLEGETVVDVPPELVVWEIPERYLTIPLEGQAHPPAKAAATTP